MLDGRPGIFRLRTDQPISDDVPASSLSRTFFAMNINVEDGTSRLRRRTSRIMNKYIESIQDRNCPFRYSNFFIENAV